MVDLADIDLSDRGTQVMLGAAAIGAGLILTMLRRGGGEETADGKETLIAVPGGWGNRSDVPGAFGWVGTFPSGPIQKPPDTDPDPADPDPDPVDPDPDPDPVEMDWQWVDPAGKPYSCPAGSRMAWGKGIDAKNHVCVNLKTGTPHEVVYSDGRTWSDRQDGPSGDTGGGTRWVDDPDSKPYGCPPGYRLAWESTGSGNHVCTNIATGREIPTVQKGRGGDNPSGLTVPGLAASAGFSPAPITPFVPDATTVRAGESLRDVSRRMFGGSERYGLARIARLNPGIVAGGSLREGDVIKLR